MSGQEKRKVRPVFCWEQKILFASILTVNCSIAWLQMFVFMNSLIEWCQLCLSMQHLKALQVTTSLTVTTYSKPTTPGLQLWQQPIG